MENNLFWFFGVAKINIHMDAPSLSEEVELIESGPGGHTPAEHQNPSPLFTCSSGMNRKGSLLTDYL
jgi:hypothetical protein